MKRPSADRANEAASAANSACSRVLRRRVVHIPATDESLDYVSPMQFEENWLASQASA